ncbi:MAG: hypothetical protein HYU55_20585, partial [Nocardioides sp.]|nr:hypothetical protein [Nocardioides sp.]
MFRPPLRTPRRTPRAFLHTVLLAAVSGALAVTTAAVLAGSGPADAAGARTSAPAAQRSGNVVTPGDF